VNQPSARRVQEHTSRYKIATQIEKIAMFVPAHRVRSRWYENPFDELATPIHEFRATNA
jgi:hypothetical protein